MANLSSNAVVALFVTTALSVLLGACKPVEDSPTDVPRIAGAGAEVVLQYTIRLDDGTEVASNIGAAPLEFTLGRDEIFPALEAALEGLAIGDERRVSLTIEEGYGPRDEKAVREVELSLVPEESRIVGAILLADDDNGGQREVTVLEVAEKTAILDLNHPLAGQALLIDVRVLGIEPPRIGG